MNAALSPKVQLKSWALVTALEARVSRIQFMKEDAFLQAQAKQVRRLLKQRLCALAPPPHAITVLLLLLLLLLLLVHLHACLFVLDGVLK